jgi:NAD(P)-dependent dehydrogenase (short-subunit alcohol dehydrogenase family)
MDLGSPPARSPFDLAGQRVLVTGASSGLGEHFATLLASCGAHVIVAARRAERLRDLTQRLRDGHGVQAEAVALDVCSADSVRAAFDQIAHWGGLDVVINNAGVSVGKPALEQTESDWDQVLDTNLKGAWLVCTEAARRWVDAGRGGSIVNVASILGERVATGLAPYAVSKAGLLQLTKALAMEWARHAIRVNALAPGYIETDLTREFLHSESGIRMAARIPQRRFADPRDLDGAVLLLASSAGRRMTGTVIPVDGGHLVSPA